MNKLKADSRKFGKYQILRRISIGGMAEVYHAEFVNDQGFRKEVAVKRLLPLVDDDNSFREMFVHEAKLASLLNHSNIAQIYELGQVGSSYFIAMEYVHGETLRRIQRALRDRERPLEPMFAALITAEVANGLHFAHQKHAADGSPLNIVHRDISPQNILVSFSGSVKIIDFGIAKATGRAFQTKSGIVKGKCSYMSPEQIGKGDVDHRSDIFALGTVFYELLTGEKLFDGEDVGDIMDKISECVAPEFAGRGDLSPEMVAIVQRALSRRPEDRYQAAGDMHRELMNLILKCPDPPDSHHLSDLMQHLFPDAVDDRRLIEEYQLKQAQLLDCAEDREEETTDEQEVSDATGVLITSEMDEESLRRHVDAISSATLSTNLDGAAPAAEDSGIPAVRQVRAPRSGLAREIIVDVFASCVIIAVVAVILWLVFGG